MLPGIPDVEAGTNGTGGSAMLHAAPALALFVGPALILYAVNAAWRERVHMEPPIGVPVSEAFIDPLWQPLQATMREVFETGVEAYLDFAGVPVFIIPTRVGTARAVVTLARARAGTPQAAPVPLELAAQTGP